MPTQSRSYAVFNYLNNSVLGGKWLLKWEPAGFLSAKPLNSSYDDREFRASYDEGDTLVLSIRIGDDAPVRHQKETGTRLTGEENTSGARLLLELALYMLSAGALDPGDISDALAPRQLPPL